MITGSWYLQVAGIVRYFEKQEEDPSKATKVVCKHCGAKGEHKTFECPILIVSAHSYPSWHGSHRPASASRVVPETSTAPVAARSAKHALTVGSRDTSPRSVHLAVARAVYRGQDLD
jgi:hypothetical protein